MLNKHYKLCPHLSHTYSPRVGDVNNLPRGPTLPLLNPQMKSLCGSLYPLPKTQFYPHSIISCIPLEGENPPYSHNLYPAHTTDVRYYWYGTTSILLPQNLSCPHPPHSDRNSTLLPHTAPIQPPLTPQM